MGMLNPCCHHSVAHMHLHAHKHTSVLVAMNNSSESPKGTLHNPITPLATVINNTDMHELPFRSHHLAQTLTHKMCSREMCLLYICASLDYLNVFVCFILWQNCTFAGKQHFIFKHYFVLKAQQTGRVEEDSLKFIIHNPEGDTSKLKVLS